MLAGHIDYPETYLSLLDHDCWQAAFEWLAKSKEKGDGEYEIISRDIYASVQTIQTLSREEGNFEAHQTYIDLHYCIQGKEVIEWAPVDTLKPKTKFNTKKDFSLYEAPKTAGQLMLSPGTFAIFLPADAHMPKISDGINTSTKKVVIKIKLDLLGVS